METLLMDLPDRTLLDRYLNDRDHAAFSELVRRHLPPVHSALLRFSANPTLAEEVTQSVFCRLAGLRVIPPPNFPLIAWLHRTARSTALNLMRTESRRRKRESMFSDLLTVPADPLPWEQISPVLDEVIDRLPAGERGLVLRRFFSGESYALIAGELNLSEDAVRMRIRRALDRMRNLLSRKGINTTASALAAGLPVHAAVPFLTELSSSVAAAALLAPIPTYPILTLGIFAAVTHKTALITAISLLLAGTFAILHYRDAPAQGPANQPAVVHAWKPAAGTSGTAKNPAIMPPSSTVPLPAKTDNKPEWMVWLDRKFAEANAQLPESKKKASRDMIKEIHEKALRENPPATADEIARFLELAGHSSEGLGWAFTRSRNLDYLKEGLSGKPDSSFLRFLAAAMPDSLRRENPEAAALSLASLRWLETHEPALHAVLRTNAGEPVPPRGLEALNKGEYDVIPDDLLRRKDEEFLMGIRGFSAAFAATFVVRRCGIGSCAHDAWLRDWRADWTEPRPREQRLMCLQSRADLS